MQSHRSLGRGDECMDHKKELSIRRCQETSECIQVILKNNRLLISTCSFDHMDSRQPSLKKFSEISCLSNLLIFGSKPIKKELHISLKYSQLASLFLQFLHSCSRTPFLEIWSWWRSHALTTDSMIVLLSLLSVCFPVSNNLLLSYWAFHITSCTNLPVGCTKAWPNFICCVFIW